MTILAVLMAIGYLSAQCPDRNFLWNRILYLRDSSKVPPKEQKAELLRYAQQMNRCPYRNDSTHALLLQRIGWLYSTEKDYAMAIRYTKQSLDIIYNNSNQASVNYSHAIKSYYNLRIFYDSCEQYRLEQRAMDSCIGISIRLRKGYEYSLVLLPIRMFSYLESGDYYKYLQFSDIVEAACKTQAGYSYYLYYYLIWKINSLIFLKKYDEATDLLGKTIPNYMKSTDRSLLGTFYGLLAKISAEKKDEKKTLFYVNKAIQFNKDSNNVNVNAENLNNVGYILYFTQLKNSRRALYFYKEALKYANADEALNIYNNIAEVYISEKNFDSAFYFFQSAFDKIKKGVNETDLLTHTSEYISRSMVAYVINLVLNKADAYLKYYREENKTESLMKAIQTYKIADQLLSRIKQLQYDVESKLFWRQNIHRLYETAIEACFLQKDVASAFYFFERSRAILLNDQLNEHRWMGSEEILEQAQLKKQILAAEQQLTSIPAQSSKYNELQSELFSKRQQLDKLQDLIKEKVPLYYQNFIDSNSISVPEAQHILLKDHAAIVELFAGDSTVFLLSIDNRNHWLTKINKSQFDNLSSAFSTFLSKVDLLNRKFDSFVSVSHSLYQLLFQNINLPKGRIIISPAGNYFPFEALVTDAKQLNYFGKDHAVSYTYSARFLLNVFNTDSPANRGFMGFAPVKFASLPDLAGSGQSLKNVQGYFGHYSTSFVGSKATKNNFLNEFYKYKIIQLYTHATDSGTGGEPVIYFADSALGLSDLLPEEKPVSNLIVLSACQTASGKLYSGEGVFSFNRSFAALGIPSTVSNLWQANDQATYKLTELFYKYVAEELPLDVAMQKAKKDLMEKPEFSQYRLPYYWASSILVGKTDAITFQKSFPLKWIASLLLVALLFIGGWRMRKKSLTSRKIQNPHERGL